ncbi:MAG: hypothetical protein Q6370_002860, partial [Candidatus Sigynarchaeota archaeon]
MLGIAGMRLVDQLANFTTASGEAYVPGMVQVVVRPGKDVNDGVAGISMEGVDFLAAATNRTVNLVGFPAGLSDWTATSSKHVLDPAEHVARWENGTGTVAVTSPGVVTLESKPLEETRVMRVVSGLGLRSPSCIAFDVSLDSTITGLVASPMGGGARLEPELPYSLAFLGVQDPLGTVIEAGYSTMIPA